MFQRTKRGGGEYIGKMQLKKRLRKAGKKQRNQVEERTLVFMRRDPPLRAVYQYVKKDF